MVTMTWPAPDPRPVGELLREWRERRRISQLDLAIEAEVSARHLSFVETGRSRPTPAMILRLTEHLGVPLRERNTLLLAGGYAPAYPQHGLDEPELTSVREALRQVLAGHEPYPAVLVDRWWELLDGNAGLGAARQGMCPLAARTAGERAPAGPAPGGDGAADREPRRVAGPPADPAAAPGPGPRRSAAARSARRAARLSGRDGRGDLARRAWCCRCATGVAGRNSRCSASAPRWARRPT